MISLPGYSATTQNLDTASELMERREAITPFSDDLCARNLALMLEARWNIRRVGFDYESKLASFRTYAWALTPPSTMADTEIPFAYYRTPFNKFMHFEEIAAMRELLRIPLREVHDDDTFFLRAQKLMETRYMTPGHKKQCEADIRNHIAVMLFRGWEINWRTQMVRSPFGGKGYAGDLWTITPPPDLKTKRLKQRGYDLFPSLAEIVGLFRMTFTG